MSEAGADASSPGGGAGGPSLARNLVTFVVFQVIWTACVAGTGKGNDLVGPASLLLLVLLLPFITDRRCELRLWLTVGLLGTVIDSGLLALGWIDFPHSPEWWPAWLVPFWISGLWVSFAALLRSCLVWLRGRTLLAFLFGLVGGPFSFHMGTRLEAVVVTEPSWRGYAALAVEWATLTPALIALAHRDDPSGV